MDLISWDHTPLSPKTNCLVSLVEIPASVISKTTKRNVSIAPSDWQTWPTALSFGCEWVFWSLDLFSHLNPHQRPRAIQRRRRVWHPVFMPKPGGSRAVEWRLMDGLTLPTELLALADLEYCEACMLQYTLHSDSVFKNLSACYIAATYVFVFMPGVDFHWFVHGGSFNKYFQFHKLRAFNYLSFVQIHNSRVDI